MSNMSLGARLAKNISEEDRNTREAAERKAALESAEGRANFKTIEDFFIGCEKYFTAGILAGTPTKKLLVIVGTPAIGNSQNSEVYSLLRLYDSSNPPKVTKPNHLYYGLWLDFVQWATQNELVAEWQYTHDGVGLLSWYHLVIKPAINSAKS